MGNHLKEYYIMDRDLILKRIDSVRVNSVKVYNYFILTFTSSLPFYLFLMSISLAYLVFSFVLGFSGPIITALGTITLCAWLLHGIHGVLHIIGDYVYNKTCKIVLTTFFSLILLKGSVLIFLI